MSLKSFTFAVYAGVAVAVVGPGFLHDHPERDCQPQIELCPVSDAAYLPDEPEPEPSPLLISGGQLTVASSTVTATGSSLAQSWRLSSLNPPRWRPLSAGDEYDANHD